MGKRVADILLVRLALDPAWAFYTSGMGGMILSLLTKAYEYAWPIWVTVGLCATAALAILLIVPQWAWANSRARTRGAFSLDLMRFQEAGRDLLDFSFGDEIAHDEWHSRVFQRLLEFDEVWAHEFAAVHTHYDGQRVLMEEMGKLASFQKTLRTERQPY